MIRAPDFWSGFFFTIVYILKGFGRHFTAFYIFVAQILVQPVSHFAPQMKAGIISRSRNTVIFVRIIGALKIYIILYHGFDHFDAILKMDIIISSAMDDEEFSFYSIRKI